MAGLWVWPWLWHGHGCDRSDDGHDGAECMSLPCLSLTTSKEYGTMFVQDLECAVL